ncbi:aminoacetone oxidase family FAD-binding enzyme [Metarhizobium album]|uniref:Aminoacetone oxidase family FAD-binding enzyme n=1 Tax=Metarhizobium album TaxID=2182425 RepID=A0A2U2DKR5_9HYPH|nr:TIGR03862 family flavoprotein [Rhizobium album]PWE53860.1 aminoacetone oxidase family FAD-binding enzyme [Rhizobium album]
MTPRKIAIVGGGPAGLMAAEWLSECGYAVSIFEAMPTIGRKFLLAGKSGLNITHGEAYEQFATRFGDASQRLRPALDAFGPDDIRRWAAGLGTETFVGTSGRVFPTVMKASPLLRAWRQRLESQGVRLFVRHRWTGFAGNAPVFATPEGQVVVESDAVLLALGGASWPRLGSDGSWMAGLRDRGVAVADLQPANCGFDVDWSPGFGDRLAGEPVKSVLATSAAGALQGEFVITRHGVEGSLIYAHAASLRDRIASDGHAVLELDLMPGRSLERLTRDLARQDGKASLSNRLRKGAGLDKVKSALVRDYADASLRGDPARLAGLIKALPLRLVRPRPIAEAISSAGGVVWDGLDDRYMLTAQPGLFVAGEMIDWEAPTGGYLLSACLATGRAAASGIHDWLRSAG